MGMLKPLDAAWLYVDTKETPMHVGCLAIFSLPHDAGPDFIPSLFSHLRETPRFASPFNLKLVSPKLKSVLPMWKTADEIDLDYHLRHSALPKPGGERELGVLVSRLHSHPMDFNRPLWEAHVIEGLENGRFALYMKMHHSMVDGVGGMRMLQKMMVPDPKASAMPPPWAIGRGQRAPGALKPPAWARPCVPSFRPRRRLAKRWGICWSSIFGTARPMRHCLSKGRAPFSTSASRVNDASPPSTTRWQGSRRWPRRHRYRSMMSFWRCAAAPCGAIWRRFRRCPRAR